MKYCFDDHNEEIRNLFNHVVKSTIDGNEMNLFNSEGDLLMTLAK
jgi:hypothetical protein